MQNATTLTPRPASDTAPSAMLTTQEAARYLGLAVSTLNKWRVFGEGPVFVKLGRAVRYRKDDLNAFLAERAKHSTSEA